MGLKLGLYDLIGSNSPFALRRDSEPSVRWLMTSAVVGGVTAQLLTYPLDTIRKRLQVSQLGAGLSQGRTANGLSGVKATARSIYSAQGLGGFYSGFTLALLYSIPRVLLTFSAYEGIKRTYFW